MKNQILVKRYALGLVNALRDEEEWRRVRKELTDLSSLIKSHQPLGRVLTSPLLKAKKKSDILSGILEAMSAEDKTRRFVGLLVEHGRLNLLDEIVASLSEAWDRKQGTPTFEVSSVIPLAERQKERLKSELERLEKRSVSLVFKIDPEIIGGLSLKKGHIVYDASVEGDLRKIQAKIQEG